MTKFAVLYDAGAVPAGEIGVGLADLGEIVFLVPDDSDHVAQLRPVMEMLGEVRPLTDPAADAASVRPDAVLTFSERMIVPAAELAAAAGVPGQSVRTAKLFIDKGRQRQVLRDARVDPTRTAVAETFDALPGALAEIGLPVIVKPVTGRSSRDTYAVRTDDDVREVLAEIGALAEWSPFIVEEFLAGRPSEPFGDYVSVESACTPTGITHFVVTGKTPLAPPFRGTGRIWPSHLPEAENQEVCDMVTRALEAVGSDCGYTHTELKLTAAGPRVIEINGRLSAHVNSMAQESCGVDLVRVGGLIALGEQPHLPPFDFGGKVHFQYNNIAPVAPARLEDVRGGDAVRALPGVTAYRNFVRPGDELPGGTMKVELDTLSGVCDGHDEVMRTIDAARGSLTFEFLFADGVRPVNGLDLTNH
ncbi:ATP-grasp domain-containing protein [Actinocrispum wychmicini]|uniref:ATP-grasp domain-containing protein n=1 Tax=Actinocrispum wychmicini TaxID=1213861 RepID=A0A4R2JFR4_9PSEU|nr:ATP-grasp domain-containing protein [Actinocrispum wychmicini]TCO55746.1 ATP-grasp domain-containing protein [Actinocrispum wychmicini]